MVRSIIIIIIIKNCCFGWQRLENFELIYIYKIYVVQLLFLTSLLSPSLAWPRPRILARLSQMPPKKIAQHRFSNGKKGSWMPNRIEDSLKYTKNMTIPK